MAAWASMAQNLAHEIKTPLSTVLLSAQRLQLECGENPDGDGKYAYIDRILEQVNAAENDGWLFKAVKYPETSTQED